MNCMLDGHRHVWLGAPITEWCECGDCEGTGVDRDADTRLNDVRFPDCLSCGGEGGEPIDVCETCSLCGVAAWAVDAWAVDAFEAAS